MGNSLSSTSTAGLGSTHVTSESETMSDTNISREERSESVEEFHDTMDTDEARARAKEEEMEEFRKQLKIKREQRKEILNRHRVEKAELIKSLESERKAKLETYENNRMLRELLTKHNIEIPENLQSSKENSDISDTIIQMREEFEKLKTNNNKLRRDLADSNVSLQNAYSDIADLSAQNRESIKQINALKEVISVSKTMINLREQQLNELKNKLNEIERSLADREASMLSTDLRQEYERQLQNIRTLRGLYEERARLAEVTRHGLLRELEEQKILKEAEIIKCKDLKAKVDELEAEIDQLHEKIENKNNQITSCQDETRNIQAEMTVVNKLFSQVLLGYKTKQDLDKLIHRLEEHHGLLTHMAERENGSEASSALPKLLLELISQVDDGEENNNACEASGTISTGKELLSDDSNEQNPANTSAEVIVQNLPKVWRVLMELLSHQVAVEDNATQKVTTCYKSVETKSGPVLVPSVSQTYIRLKDLIIEKLALIKEVNRMKQLNSHLETRLEEQEKRLCSVTTELSKTWHVVGRLRRHHHQLHTHEKILKYELQQKRKLLNEIKEELEYCREKWEQAREKNSQSEREFRKLRTEFSSRKVKSISSSSFNNSAESGYSDERPSDDSSESNDESEYVTEPLKRSKKKIKKSFETVMDSSTDFNLAAEREDPASDMLDVADLPLDTQDGDDHHDPYISDSCNSENFLRSGKVCEETEDELGDIVNDSCIVEPSTSDHSEGGGSTFYDKIPETTIAADGIKDNTSESNNSKKDVSHVINNCVNEIPTIDSVAILKSIAEQKERLAKKDKKLERLEKSGAALLKQTQATASVSKQIESTLDHLINRPTFNMSDNVSKSQNSTTSIDKSDNADSKTTANDKLTQIIGQNIDDSEKTNCNFNENSSTTIKNLTSIESANYENENKPTCSIDVVEVKPQNDSFMEKNQRLENVESSGLEIVKDNSNTPSTENDNLDTLPDERQNTNECEPSTSNEMDHEARFAARDLRLKRLEEQTKSLVNKVNKTTTKGVKINYKLEELHNIYGSENSRSGTPSEDSEDTQNNDSETLD